VHRERLLGGRLQEVRNLFPGNATLDPMHKPAAAFGLLLALVTTVVARGEVTLTAVTVDGRAVAIPAASEAASASPLRVPSTATSLVFEFAGAADEPAAPAGDSPAQPPRPRGSRLRHRLDGVDTSWRDGPASGRFDLRFEDHEDGAIANEIQLLEGESPGWIAAVEESRFIRHSVTAIAPPLTQHIRINFVSHYPGASVGVIGIDDVEVAIQRHGDSTVHRHAMGVDLGGRPFGPMVTPAEWEQSGNRVVMSQLRLRPRPAAHPILTIVDDQPELYGGWYQAPKVEIEPGDRVTVSWAAAWSLGVGGKGTASYENLKPGTYFFRVGAFYPNGEPSGIETVLPVEVYVPWYLRRDIWAAAAAIGLAAAVTGGRTAHVRRIKRRLAEMERERQLEQERARIARDLHDDVGAGLTEIAVQTDWLRRDVEQLHDAEITGRADRVCQSAVELIRSVDAIVWAVNPKNDTLDRFVGYLTQSADQFVRAAGLGIRLDVPDEVPATPLSGRVRHNLFLIVREAVNNAVKHAQAKLVRLGVRLDGRLDGGRVTITVEDDGRGFDPNEPADDGRHSGLANMRRRADDIGGTLTLTSRPGSGTRVEITAPLA
jgi:signal transduction histidine kinase